MIYRNELFPIDWEVRNSLRFIGGMPDLSQFDHVFVSCSGGKDSQAMAYLISNLAEMQGYSKDNIELIYADTGLEWHDTYDHVKVIGQALGIKTVMVLPKYKLLDNVRRRWEKFNGSNSQTEPNRTEPNRTEPNRTGDTSTATEKLSTHFRTMYGGIAPVQRQTISTRQFADNLSVPISTVPILQQRSQKIANRAVCAFPSYRQMFCRSQGKQFPIDNYIRKYGGGQTSQQDRSLHNLQDSAHHGESKNLKCSGSNPFPSSRLRFCTGEGKNNAIFQRLRDNQTSEDG